jgi:uncharacterized damage-inducible protein DinB
LPVNSDDFKILYPYNAWANQRTVDACATLSPEQFTRDLESSFRSVRDTIVHVMVDEQVWLERWKLKWDGTYRKESEFPDLDSVRHAWRGIEPELLAFIGGVSYEDVRRIVPHKNAAGVDFRMPLWQLMQHLVNHATYHRGQITTLVRQAGGKPIATDLVRFYRERD